MAEWTKNVSENIEKSIDMIRHHPLVPSDIEVHGFRIDRTGETEMVVKIATNKIVEKVN